MTPANTPTFLFAILDFGYPASSNTLNAFSRKIRSCGSIVLASRGVMLKNSASNLSTSSRNPPHFVYILSRFALSGSYIDSASQRSFGISVIQSVPSFRFFQNTSKLSAFGYFPLIPMIAISSFSGT